jgi:hypothetical protein
MTERKMSPKGFLHKANGKVSAEAFLAQHRAWLTTGELAQFTSPILAKLDAKEAMPTATLEQIKSVVLSHHLAVEVRKAETAMEKASEPQTSKNYLATIWDKDGNVCTRINEKGEEVELRQSFDLGSDAERWTDRRLYEGASDWFGVIEMTKMHNAHGEPISTVIKREDAMGRIDKKSKSAVMKAKPKSTNSLGFGVKAKQDHAQFSRG